MLRVPIFFKHLLSARHLIHNFLSLFITLVLLQLFAYCYESSLQGGSFEFIIDNWQRLARLLVLSACFYTCAISFILLAPSQWSHLSPSSSSSPQHHRANHSLSSVSSSSQLFYQPLQQRDSTNDNDNNHTSVTHHSSSPSTLLFFPVPIFRIFSFFIALVYLVYTISYDLGLGFSHHGAANLGVFFMVFVPLQLLVLQQHFSCKILGIKIHFLVHAILALVIGIYMLPYYWHADELFRSVS